MAISSSDILDTFEQELAALRLGFALRMPDRIAEIETAWQKTCSLSPWRIEDLKEFHRLSHSLAGASASYGFMAVGRAARSLESYLKTELIKQVPRPEAYPSLAAHITELLATLKEAAQKPDELYPTASSLMGVGEVESWLRLNDEHTLYIVEPDTRLARNIGAQLGNFGYKVSLFTDLSEITAAEFKAPSAMLVNFHLETDSFLHSGALTRLQQEWQKTLPVIFISLLSDLPARLAAVRAGAAAYFTKPLELNALVDELDRLTTREAPEPYRILIVEDDPSLAALYSLSLQQAGMITVTVSDPLQIMPPLVEFTPDLILMDVYMPGCTGLELAAVLRQQAAYLGTPIVFLSTETDVDKQQAAMKQGGDDFLIKPIQLDLLVSAVRNRAERSRTLRSAMVRDSLTGLVNHTKLKEYLNVEVGRVGRTNRPLSFVMLDIDYFKVVNDTYGHSAGDNVIKSLARILQQRLRRTDILGRYGGEEFAIILPDTSGEDALQVVNEIRESFAQIRQYSGNTEFSVTFSAGIATFPPCSDAADLNEVADKALYAAKQAGRNRIVLARL